MNVELPEPVPLAMPPGDAEVLTEEVQEIAGAAFHLNVLASSLAGPAVTAPRWLGDDAVAAAEQVGATATLAQRTADAVLSAMHRLGAHAECLHEARRQVAALEREQQDDFRAVAIRQSQVADARLAVMTGAPEWVGPLDDLRAAEESRRRRHAALLDEVAEDAAATARVLGESCAALGGRGAPGDAARVLAHFAAQLPGWGDRELALRGRALAEILIGELRHPDEQDELAGDVLALAGTAAFAEAFLLRLREDGMRAMLELLGDGDFGADSALPALMVAVLGAAGPTGFPDGVDAVVNAPYVDAADLGFHPDKVVLGMAVVLAAAASRGAGGGLPPATVATWGGQIILRESRQGAAAIERADPMMRPHPEVDAVPLVVDLLSRGDDTRAAAALLADPDSWTVLLARRWDDCGAGLAGLVHLAGREAGRDGGTALRAGLEALGTGLDDGDPDGWTVQKATANAVTKPLGEGLAVHWGVPAGILAAGADGETSRRDGDRLRGLGYLSIEPAAATAVGEAVATWMAHQPSRITATTASVVVAVPAAWFAVQEYGQRLAHALRAFELEAAAQARELEWDATVGLAVEVPKGAVGGVVGALEPVAAKLLGADGAWEAVPDQGAVFERADAAAVARARSHLWDPAELAELTARAGAAFDGVARVLGRPDPPTPPDTSWAMTLVEAAAQSGIVRLDGVLDELRRQQR